MTFTGYLSCQPCSPAAPSSWRCRLVAGPSSTSALLRQWWLVATVEACINGWDFSEVTGSLQSALSASLAVWHPTSGLKAYRGGWQRVRNLDVRAKIVTYLI